MLQERLAEWTLVENRCSNVHERSLILEGLNGHFKGSIHLFWSVRSCRFPRPMVAIYFTERREICTIYVLLFVQSKKEIKAMLDHVFHCNVGRCIRFIVFTVFIMHHRYHDISLTSGMIGQDDKTKTLSTETSLAQHFCFDAELHKCNQDIQNVHAIFPINIQRGIFWE